MSYWLRTLEVSNVQEWESPASFPVMEPTM